jgi:hypothetical protein
MLKAPRKIEKSPKLRRRHKPLQLRAQRMPIRRRRIPHKHLLTNKLLKKTSKRWLLQVMTSLLSMSPGS